MPIANRPLSPHLQVYKLPLTALMSISHRGTGIALSAGTLYLVWQLLAAASGPDAFEIFQGFAGSWLGLLVLFGWSVALFYHLCNGIRHLFWDVGMAFSNEATDKANRAVLIATVALTIVAWVAGLGTWGGK
ncbi:MAG TPA: succinate dehydrogenase, cytochrome b556 subunit [Aliidongia sp.]|uniref:succinate dehydrogenase, cytochrome b556 subunit n=1 Tax=Aliidongia sp. TaxID=1914230 RepID=UPI002DDCD789|nr:succinate dehydrogenase, cytochrome b556 subunit [Aliidongia sp.]HEV2675866.1 succinate dehydrogenase, cytochrome b556 subunit [Aliidongia sp.]